MFIRLFLTAAVSLAFTAPAMAQGFDFDFGQMNQAGRQMGRMGSRMGGNMGGQMRQVGGQMQRVGQFGQSVFGSGGFPGGSGGFPGGSGGGGGDGTAGATGDFGGHDNQTTNTWADYDQQSVEGHPVTGGRKNTYTGKQVGGFGGSWGGGPMLMNSASSVPQLGSFKAPGNFALRQQKKSSLPPTVLDSFVLESGLDDHIYGDEGYMDAPPYEDFTRQHRIITGIEKSGSAKDLSTGHGSYMPSAWGTPDEEFSVSAPSP